MTEQFSIGQFTVDEKATVPNHPRWTLTTGQFCATDQHYYTRTEIPDQEEKIKSPRFAFLKISASTHCTHLQIHSCQSLAQALQKSAILPTLKKSIILNHKN